MKELNLQNTDNGNEYSDSNHQYTNDNEYHNHTNDSSAIDVVPEKETTSIIGDENKVEASSNTTVNDSNGGVQATNAEEYLDLTIDNMGDYLESVPSCNAMLKDLYHKSIKDYLGFLVRLGIMGLISLAFLYWTFHTKHVAIRSILLLMVICTAMIGTSNEVVLKYSIKNVLWYKRLINSKPDCILMGVVTNKLNVKKSNKRYVILNNMYHLDVEDFSEYSEININGVIIVVVKDGVYHSLSAEEFLGMETPKVSFKEFMK